MYTKVTKLLCYDWSRAVQLIQYQHPVKIITLSFFANGTSANFIKDRLKSVFNCVDGAANVFQQFKLGASDDFEFNMTLYAP